MRRFFLWLGLLFKRQLKSTAMICFLAGIVLFGIIFVKFPAFREAGENTVGLVVQGDDETARKTADRLLSGQYSASFYEYENAGELLAAIESGDASYGYVFDANFTRRLDAGNYKGCIKLYQGGSGVMSYMTNEIVFAEMFRVYGLNMAENYIMQEEMFSRVRSEAVEQVRLRYEHYGEGSDTFHIDFETLEGSINTASDNVQGDALNTQENLTDGAEADIGADDGSASEKVRSSGMVFPLRGVLSVLVFLAGLYGGVWWLQDRNNGVFLVLPRRMRNAGRFLYAFVPTFLFAAAAELTMSITQTAVYPFEIVKMLLYVLAVTVFAGILTVIVPDEKIMVSSIPVFAAASLLFCPVFVNLTQAVPFVGYFARLLLPYYYLV